MGFGWAGAAAGAREGLEALLTRAFAERQQRESSQRADALLKIHEQNAADTRQRNARDQQLQEAAIALQQADAMGQGSELSPDVATLLSDTAYGARVQQHETLPSRTSPGFGGGDVSDPGGRLYATLRPTQAQMREQQQRTQLDQLSSDPSLSPVMRRFMDFRRAGVALPNPESLETSAEREARATRAQQADFSDFTRRTDYSARVQAAARQQAAREAANAPVTARDRREALRLADTAASNYLNAIQDNLGMLPADVDAVAVRQQFVDEYMASLEPPTSAISPRNTQRVLDELRPIVQPTRTGRMVGDYLMPRRTPSTTAIPRAAAPQAGEIRIFDGQRAQWDGHGWLAVN